MINVMLTNSITIMTSPTRGRVTYTNGAMQEGDYSVTMPLPMFEYSDYSITASPSCWLDSGKVTLDLGSWTFYDHLRGRPIGTIQLNAPRPDDPRLWEFVRFYVKEARKLDADELNQWCDALLTVKREREEADGANTHS